MKRVLAVVLVSLAGCGSGKSGGPLFGGFTPTSGAAAILAPATCSIPFVGTTGISGILVELASGADACNVLTQAKQCGVIADGCGGFLGCGTCAPGSRCMGDLTCCTLKTCSALGAVLPEGEDHKLAPSRDIADRLMACFGSMLLYWYHFSHSGRRIDVAVPGVLALAVISTAFTGQAISTAFDRRYGVLRLLGVSPLGRSGLLVAKALAVLTIELLQFIVIGALGLALGWHPHWLGLFPAALLALAGTWTFVALALLLAGTLRAEGVLALANLIWILLLGLGGVIVPPGQLPAGLSHLATLLPSGALADGLRQAFIGGGLAAIPLLVLVAWGAVATYLASRTFRWSD